jgi:hypothetical protein
MHLPQWALDEFFKIIPGSVWDATWRTYAFPCSATLPNLIFGIGKDYKGAIPSSHIHVGSIDIKMCVSQLFLCGDYCGWGDPVIMSQFLIHDYANNRVGFADKTSY